MSDLENLYIKRNEAYKVNDIETVNNITEELNSLYPVKPKSVLCIDGKPVQFEIAGQLNVGCFMDDNGWQGSNGKNMLLVNGKTAYKRVLIRKRA